MKAYMFISKHKSQYPMYKAYFEAMRQELDVTDILKDADVAFIMGAWTMEGARLAKQCFKMGIPYIVCPMGDISERNRKNPYLKRTIQSAVYQKGMYKKASLVVATTPLEQSYMARLGWNKHIVLLRYFHYSHLITENEMKEWLQKMGATTLSCFEQQKAEAIAARTKEAIIAQILQIQSRMPHKNIPQKYLDDLHTLLYADNYDEDAICAELKSLKLSSYSASVFQAMTEKTGLTEGFMPLPAKKGRKSKQILKYIS